MSTNQYTDVDMREQVTASLAAYADEFDVPAIVAELRRQFGAVHIDSIASDTYWDIVKLYAWRDDAISDIRVNCGHVWHFAEYPEHLPPTDPCPQCGDHA